MKVAAHVLAYNVDRFIGPVLRNMAPHVDKIYVAYPTRPWGYNEHSRSEMSNPTPLTYIKELATAISDCVIEIITGDWVTEDDMRNACLEKARIEGFDWFIIQDTDEFYTEHTWRQIKKIFLKDKQHDHFITTWFNFWKSSQYVMVYKNGSIKGTNAGFAIRCSSNIKFIRKRVCNNEVRRVIDCPCFHYGYVMSDAQMLEKISTWGHSNELFADKYKWYQYKWLNWTEDTKYLHPVHPDEWIKAINFPFEQPDFAEEFALPLMDKKKINLNDWLGNEYYDVRSNLHFIKKSLKYTSNVILGNEV